MARRRVQETEVAQIALIEVEHPMAKPFKALRRKYEGLGDEKNAAGQAMKKVRESIIALIKEHGIKPNADGVIQFQLDDELIEITPGESKLHFKNKPKPTEPDPADDETDES